MSEDAESTEKPPFVAFKVPCPNCSNGVRTVARMGLRDGRTGTGYIPETCRDCKGRGWLPLGNGEKKKRPKSGH
ncbi:hypothetical protein [Kitasatospora sp. NPDC092286]|uniref:hypothetical protein n=1 Tax=Kitasatospora sp. NPDC092286 TaxID=3364087 RepID=UPI0037FC0951